MPDDARIRVLIADDHALFRYGVRAMLASEEGFEVAGEAAAGEEAVALAAELGPDVVLMDIQMPGINGIEATRRIVEKDPRVGVVVVDRGPTIIPRPDGQSRFGHDPIPDHITYGTAMRPPATMAMMMRATPQVCIQVSGYR